MVSQIKKKWNTAIELLVIAIISLVPLLWFPQDHMLIGYDSGYPINYISYLLQRIYTWLPSVNFGVDGTSSMGQVPFLVILALPRFIGIPHYDVQKIIFVFWFFAMSASMYVLVRYLFSAPRQWLIRLSAIFIYSFNLYIYSFWLQGAQPTFSMLTLLPLTTFLLIKFFRKEIPSIKSALYLSFFLFVFNAGGVYGVPLLGAVIFTSLVLVVYYFILLIREEKVMLVKRFFVFCSITIIVQAFLNAYLLLPFINSFRNQFASTVGRVGGFDSAISWAEYISQHTNFTNLIRLQGDLGWYERIDSYSSVYLNNLLFIALSFILPLLALLSYFLVKTKKEREIVLFFLFIFTVGLFLASGTHTSFGGLYELFMKKIPGFIAFRSPYYKFFPVIYFACAILSSVSIFYLFEKIKKKPARVFVSVLFLLCIAAYNFPFFDKKNFVFEKPYSTMLHIPTYVQELGDYENSSKSLGRTVILPPLGGGLAVSVYSWGYWSPTSIFTGLTNNTFLQNDSSLSVSEGIMLQAFYQAIRNQNEKEIITFSKFLNIESVILREDVPFSYFRTVTENPQKLKKNLEGSGLFTFAWKKGPWTIYNLIGGGSKHIYATNDIIKLSQLPGEENTPFLEDSPRDFIDKDFPLGIRGLISKDITFFPCISCILLANPSEEKVTYTRVLPGSRLYALKLSKDEGSLKNKSGNGLIQTYLNLSERRITELSMLRDKPSLLSEKNAWTDSAKHLESYWVQIGNLSREEFARENLELLPQVNQASKKQEKKIRNIYEGLFLDRRDALKLALAGALTSLKQIQASVNNYLHEENIGKTYTYQLGSNVSKIEIPIKTLPGDILNNPLYPSRIDIDDKQVSPLALSTQGNIFTIENNQRKHFLTLTFNDLPNLLTTMHEETITLPDTSQYCKSSNIQNYEWTEKYIVEAKTQHIAADESIYIFFDQELDKTSQEQETYGSFFPDKSFSLEKGSQKFQYILSGSPNRTHVRVYFCSDSIQALSEKFINPGVYLLKTPSVYSSKENNFFKKNQLPKIVFTENNPTSYTIQIKNANSPYVLSFLERFSNLWQAKIVTGSKKETIKNDDHFILDGYANGWRIDKTGNYTIELSFASQEWLLKGLVITILTVTIITTYFVVDWIYILFKKDEV